MGWYNESMNFRKKIGISIIALLAVAIVIYTTRTFTDTGTAIFYLSLSFVVTLSILFFLENMVFTTWKKFAIPYIIISVLILIFAGNSGGGWGVGSIIDDREGIAMILSALFLIISLLIIAIKSWRLRG